MSLLDAELNGENAEEERKEFEYIIGEIVKNTEFESTQKNALIQNLLEKQNARGKSESESSPISYFRGTTRLSAPKNQNNSQIRLEKMLGHVQQSAKSLPQERRDEVLALLHEQRIKHEKKGAKKQNGYDVRRHRRGGAYHIYGKPRRVYNWDLFTGGDN